VEDHVSDAPGLGAAACALAVGGRLPLGMLALNCYAVGVNDRWCFGLKSVCVGGEEQHGGVDGGACIQYLLRSFQQFVDLLGDPAVLMYDFTPSARPETISL
jgi:hypothetical protein